MTTNLGNIHNVKPRHAENADARFDIRRHDPDQERRRKEQDSGEKKITFDTYDNAVVSVDALRAFLENFLKSLHKPDTQKNMAAPAEKPEAAPPAESPERAVSAQATRAASLYQSAAKTAPRAVPPPPAENKKSTQDELGNEDVRTIHRLLSDIAILQARRIEYLKIEKGETFLASLSAAVEKAKGS